MTIPELVHGIAQLDINDIEEVAGLIFDEIEATRPQDVQAFYEALLGAGVDVGKLCKKKHPT